MSRRSTLLALALTKGTTVILKTEAELPVGLFTIRAGRSPSYDVVVRRELHQGRITVHRIQYPKLLHPF